MTNLIAFFLQIFPIKKRIMFSGLSYGIFLVALFWYPFPMLLRSLTFSPILRNAIILALICFLAILFLSGKLFLKDYAIIGWTAIGSLIFGIVLVVLFHKEYIGSLIFALCALAIYVRVSLVNKFRNKLWSAMCIAKKVLAVKFFGIQNIKAFFTKPTLFLTQY